MSVSAGRAIPRFSAALPAYNGDVLGFFHKWLQDMRDSQGENGAYPDVAPRIRVVGDGAAAWSDAGIIVPHIMYTMYGDCSIIEEHFASMEKYMDFLASRRMEGPIARYGDWLAYEPTAKEYISIVYYAYDARLMAEMAAAIGPRRPCGALPRSAGKDHCPLSCHLSA